MNIPLTQECIGRKIELKKTHEIGVIIDLQYILDLNHYRFKIRTKNKTITIFDENEFIFI